MSSIIKPKSPADLPDGPISVYGQIFADDDDRFQPLDRLWGGLDNTILTPQDEIARQKEQAKAECEVMLRKAKEEKARIEKEAYDRGFAQGEQAGTAAGKKKFETVTQQFEELVRRMASHREQLHLRYERDLVALVKMICDRLLHHELATNPRVIEACLREALQFVADNAVVRVYLSPDDFNRLRETALDLGELFGGRKRIDLLEDATIAPGGCRLETDFGEVDATLESRREQLFARLDVALTGSPSEEGS